MWRFTTRNERPGNTQENVYTHENSVMAEIVLAHLLIGITGAVKYRGNPWKVVEASPGRIVVTRYEAALGLDTRTFERLPDGSGKGK